MKLPPACLRSTTACFWIASLPAVLWLVPLRAPAPVRSSARPHAHATEPGAQLSSAQSASGDMSEGDRLLGEGEYRAAAKLYAAVTRADPKNGLAWFRQGLALHLAREFEAALSAHKQASRFAHLRAPALYNVACAYAMLERTEEGIHWLARARSAMLDEQDLITLLETDTELDNLRDDPRFGQIVAGTFERPDEFAGARGCELAEGAALDFCLGSWDVEWSGGKAHAQVERVLGKCVVQERFESESAHATIETLSLAAFDPQVGRWRMTRADNQGRLIVFEGAAGDDRIVLESADAPAGNGWERLRVRWLNIRPGSFNWELERSNDRGETWELLRRMRYLRR